MPTLSPLVKSNLFRGFILLLILGGVALFLPGQPKQKATPDTTVLALHPLRTDVVQTVDVTGEVKPFQQVEVERTRHLEPV